MAEEEKWGDSNEVENTDNGHYTHYLLPVQNVAEESLSFAKRVDVFCQQITAFVLKIDYEHKQEADKFSLSATLQRIDSKDSKLHGSVILSCLDANNRVVGSTQVICEKEMSAGDMIQGCVEKSISLVSALKVSQYIKFCHDRKASAPKANIEYDPPEMETIYI